MKCIKTYKKKLRLSFELIYGKREAAEQAAHLFKTTKMRLVLALISLVILIFILELDETLIIISLLAAVLIIILPYKKLKEEERAMREGLIYGLEALINEINMLLSAGLSLEASMKKISYNPPDYITIIRLFEHIEEEGELGFSLYVALASFAKLYRNNYMYRFNAALASSGKTGSSSLQTNLNELKNRIISEKRANIRRKAETLSTKLLMPLMLSLLGIFGMLLFPIFQQLTM